MRAVILFALIFALVLAEAAPPRPAALRGKPAPAVSDATIEQNIRMRFAKSKIAADKFVVRVQGGVAVIEGSTSIIQRKGVATRLAKSGGATAVDNRIVISEDARLKASEKLRELKPRQAARRSERPTSATSVRGAQTVAVSEPVKPVPRAQVKH